MKLINSQLNSPFCFWYHIKDTAWFLDSPYLRSRRIHWLPHVISGSKGLWTCKNGPHTVMHPAAYDVCTFAARIHLFDGHDGQAPWSASLVAALRPLQKFRSISKPPKFRNSLHWNALSCDQGEACFEKYSGVSSAQASGERSISSTNTSRRSQMCVQSRNLFEGQKIFEGQQMKDCQKTSVLSPATSLLMPDARNFFK